MTRELTAARIGKSDVAERRSEAAVFVEKGGEVLTVKGLQFPGSREVLVKEFPDPVPGSGEVVVRMRATGICGSDLNYLYRTPKEDKDKFILGVWVSSTVIPGHEPCGVIEEVGTGVSGLKRGDRVIVYHISGCGTCVHCRAGYHIHCARKKTYGFDVDGSFADFMVAKEADCVVIPEELTFEEGAYYACGAGTAYKAVNRLGVSGADTVSVFGLGPVGLAVVMLAKQYGGKVIGVDSVSIRRELAQEIGADYVLDPRECDVVGEITDITKGRGTSVGFECSSSPVARAQILDAAGLWGRVAYLGEGKNVTIDVSNQIIHKQLTLVGSWVYNIPDLIQLVELAVEEKLPLPKLITHRFRLDQAEEALKLADSSSSGKIVFVWD